MSRSLIVASNSCVSSFILILMSGRQSLRVKSKTEPGEDSFVGSETKISEHSFTLADELLRDDHTVEFTYIYQ